MQAAESAAQKAKDLGKKGLVRDFGQQTGLGGSCRSSPPPPPPPPPSSPPPAWPPVQLGPLSACLPAHAALDGLQEVMEATAEEAGKKLSLNLALHDKVGAGAPGGVGGCVGGVWVLGDAWEEREDGWYCSPRHRHRHHLTRIRLPSPGAGLGWAALCAGAARSATSPRSTCCCHRLRPRSPTAAETGGATPPPAPVAAPALPR